MNTRYRAMSGNFLRFAVGALILAGAFAVWNASPSYSVANEAPAPVGEFDTPSSFANVIEAVRPAVVNIAVSGRQPAVNGMSPGGQGPFGPEAFPPGSPYDDFLRRFFEGSTAPDRETARPFQAMGTGFIIDPEGLVVTNYHVVESADEITVVLDDGSRHEATLRGYDEKTDLALLDVDGTDMPFVAFGDSEAARVGDWVLAIGNPFGLGGSATTGIISARGRDIQSGPFDDFLQVDAPINRGNSGGPLFDLEGKVIGVTTAIYSPNGGSVGIGFAIPSELVEPVVADLRDDGFVERGWLGVTIQGLDDELAAGLGLDEAGGALVAAVVERSPAAVAGVEPGDVILAIEGEQIEDARGLVRAVGTAHPDDDVVLEIWRDGEMLTFPIRLGLMPGTADPVAASGAKRSSSSVAELGFRVDDLDGRLRRQFRLDDTATGIVVTAVDPDGPAAKKDLQPGDLIVGIGREQVRDVAQLGDAISAAVAEEADVLVLQVQRGGERRFVALALS